MENQKKWKRVMIGIASIFVYFFFQMFASSILSYFNLDINSLNTNIKILYLIIVDILTIAPEFDSC